MEAIKAQALADFIAKFTPAHDLQNGDQGAKQWIVHVDGSSTQHAGGIGIVLQSPIGDHLEYAIRLQFQMTNNEAEYKALLQGLELAKSLGAEAVLVQGDSKLIIGQVNGTCEAKEERIKRYLGKVKQSIKGFTTTQFHQIPMEENMEADVLAKVASANELVDDQIKVQYIPSVDVPKVHQIYGEASWSTPIISYLKDGLLPKDREEARKLRVRVAKFVLMDKVLQKRGFSQPYLGCLTPNESHYIMRDIYEGACGNHSRARSLVHKIVRTGYWPSMQANAKMCDKCQC